MVLQSLSVHCARLAAVEPLCIRQCAMMVIFQRRISKLDNLQARNECQPVPVYMPYIGRSESLPESTPGLACDVCRVESAEGVSVSCLSVKRAKTDKIKNVLFYMQSMPNNLI